MKSLEMRRLLGLIATLALALVGCGEDEKDKVSVTGFVAPEVKPKVESATPSTLSSTSLLLNDSPTDPGSSMKSRLFSGSGPTDIFSILAAVDTGMDSIEKQLNGVEKGPDEDPNTITSYAPCMGSVENNAFVEKTAQAVDITFDFNADGTVDLDPSFTAHLHCYSDLTQPDGSVPTAADANPDTKYWRAFGKTGTGDDEYWYIVEGSDTASATSSQGASAIKVSKAKDEVEMWFRVGKDSTVGEGSAVIAHLKRNVGGTIEYTHSGKGVGYGCGMHTIFDKDSGLAYFKVKTDQETNGQEGIECDEFTGDTDKEYCIDISSATFSIKDDMTDCTAANLDSDALEMTMLDYTVVTHEQAVNSLNSTVPSGVVLLYMEDTPEEE